MENVIKYVTGFFGGLLSIMMAVLPVAILWNVLTGQTIFGMDVVGNLTGDVTGSVTGNVVGNTTGTHYGNVIGALDGDVTGSVFGDDSTLLVDGNNNKVLLKDQYALIEAHKGDVTFTLTDIPLGDYISIGFSIGLDSATNHGNPNQYAAEHPLSPINNSLHWNWTGGYIFTALEGKVVKDAETFIFHLAGDQNKLDFELPTSFSTSATDADKEAVITYDVSEVFKNPEIYSIASDGASSHSVSSPVTVKLIRNMSDVFTKFEVK